MASDTTSYSTQPLPHRCRHYDGRVTDRGRRVRTAVHRLLVAVLTGLLVASLVAPPATAADDDPSLAVTITAASPTRITPGKPVVLRGTVTNGDDHAWRDAQAYLVISRAPYTTRTTLDEAIDSGQSYTGTRIVRPLSAIDEIGTIAPGATRSFRVKVPYSALGLAGGEGVFPVGVQILATDADGERSNEAVGRATTFLPTAVRGPSAPSGLVWPFLMTDRRGPNGDYTDPERLVDEITTGRLRHQLDLARSVPSSAVTVMLDPALLAGVEDLLRRRHVPDGFALQDAVRDQVVSFRDDLLTLARSSALWILDFDRADVLALSESGAAGRRLLSTIDRASDSVTSRYSLKGRRVSWPTSRGVTTDVLTTVRRGGQTPVVVSRSAADDWQPSLGSVVTRGTPSGTMPLFVNHALDSGVPGVQSIATLRQRVLAEATFASLDRAADSRSRSDALSLVDPTWDPGAVGASQPLSRLFETSIVSPTSAESLLSRSPRAYRGSLPSSTSTDAVDRSQVARVDAAVRQVDLLAAAVPDSGALEDTWARAAGSTLGVRWREHRAEGRLRAERLSDAIDRELGRVTIEGPPAFTLSSSKGSLPLTISNRTDDALRLDVRIDSTNPALRVPSPDVVEVGPGERRTINVAIDLGEQSSSTLSAQLVTPSGQDLGSPTTFNIRSSRVGTAVWVAMGLALLLVVVAVGRRFSRRGRAEAEAQHG